MRTYLMSIIIIRYSDAFTQVPSRFIRDQSTNSTLYMPQNMQVIGTGNGDAVSAGHVGHCNRNE